MTTEEFKAEAGRLRPQLVREARRYLHDADDAEDVVQDALLRLWQMCPQLRVPMDALAVVVTRNLSIDRLRRLRQQPADSAELLEMQTDETDTDERMDRILAIIDTLPTLQQTILRLRHMDGMEMQDIAALIGSTAVAVRKALSRARQAVRERYFDGRNEP